MTIISIIDIILSTDILYYCHYYFGSKLFLDKLNNIIINCKVNVW